MFKKATVVLGAAVIALAMPVAAGAGNGDKATGGGQVFIDSADAKASTIAFTAQGTTDAAKGQVQLVDRSPSTPETKFHGVVDCIEVMGNVAIIGGESKRVAGDRFTLRVMDGGEPNRGADMISFERENPDDVCGDDDDDDAAPTMSLARGNAQVRDGDLSNPSRMMRFGSALKLAGLR